MRIGKDTVIDYVREHGTHDQVQRAIDELPDHVNTDEHRALLEELGIDLPGLVDYATTDKIGGLLRNE